MARGALQIPVIQPARHVQLLFRTNCIIIRYSPNSEDRRPLLGSHFLLILQTITSQVSMLQRLDSKTRILFNSHRHLDSNTRTPQYPSAPGQQYFNSPQLESSGQPYKANQQSYTPASAQSYKSLIMASRFIHHMCRINVDSCMS